MIGIILIFSPPLLQRYQLINMGYHTEVFLFIPLTFLLAFHIMNQRVAVYRVLLTGLLFGLFTSYCLTNLIAVILSLYAILFFLSSERRLQDSIFLVSGCALGFTPWMWLKFTNFQGGDIFPFLQTGQITIPNILRNLYYLIFTHLPSSVICFSDKPYFHISLLITVIIICIYLIALTGWREGFLYKCFLLYPVLFLFFFILINPVLTEQPPRVVSLQSKRLLVPMVYVFLGIYALAFNQVQQRFAQFRKTFIAFIPVSLTVLMLNLWIIIFFKFTVYNTAYGQEPGYMPVWRNYNLMTRFFDGSLQFKSSKRLLELQSIISDFDNSSSINLQSLHIFGIAVGKVLHHSVQHSSAILQVNYFASELGETKRKFFIQGLAWGCLSAVLEEKINLHTLFLELQEDDWELFSIGLINACFQLEDPTKLWSVLQYLSQRWDVSVLLPPIEVRSTLERYKKQISVLGYRCMTVPGAIRGYIQMFNNDPVSLNLLGWWLAFRMTSDTDLRWIELKVGNDYRNSIKDIMDGMKGMKKGVTFLDFFDGYPLRKYRRIDSDSSSPTQGLYKQILSANKPTWPIGTGSTKDTEVCNFILKR
jgi:hypothetical protein